MMKKENLLSVAGIAVDILFLLAFEAKKDRNEKPSETSSEQAKQMFSQESNAHAPNSMFGLTR